jgi:hypothetical protein
MKFVTPSPFADPDLAARKLVEIANASRPSAGWAHYIECVNAPFLAATLLHSSLEMIFISGRGDEDQSVGTSCHVAELAFSGCRWSLRPIFQPS